MPASTWTSRLPEFRSRHGQAQAAGLIGAANEVRNAVMEGLQFAYTSLAFNTGESVRHVTIGPPFVDEDGPAIRVGTDLDYNLSWELGHFNHWTRHYERVEIWREAYELSRETAMLAYATAYRSAMGD